MDRRDQRRVGGNRLGRWGQQHPGPHNRHQVHYSNRRVRHRTRGGGHRLTGLRRVHRKLVDRRGFAYRGLYRTGRERSFQCCRGQLHIFGDDDPCGDRPGFSAGRGALGGSGRSVQLRHLHHGRPRIRRGAVHYGPAQQCPSEGGWSEWEQHRYQRSGDRCCPRSCR